MDRKLIIYIKNAEKAKKNFINGTLQVPNKSTENYLFIAKSSTDSKKHRTISFKKFLISSLYFLYLLHQ
jgi:hypothetical protein